MAYGKGPIKMGKKKPTADTISNPGAKSTKPKRKIIGGGNVITNPGGKPPKGGKGLLLVEKEVRNNKQFKVSAPKPVKARNIVNPSLKKKPVQPKRPGGR